MLQGEADAKPAGDAKKKKKKSTASEQEPEPVVEEEAPKKKSKKSKEVIELTTSGSNPVKPLSSLTLPHILTHFASR